jgi:O-acetyl-ADP-ribose deacetylase (regulator of RNase III)
MLEYKTGDILAEETEALVNTVNCVGVMGRGIALQFKNVFPDNFKAYAEACKRQEMQPGRMFVFDTGRLTNPRYIINFPTKRHWRGKSRMEDIEAGLKALQDVIRERNIRSLAVPPLGTGLGGLAWNEVRLRIEEALGDFDDVRIVIFQPSGAPAAARIAKQQSTANMTPGRAVLVGLMDRYLNGLLDPFVTLLEVHKLMYFLKVRDEPAVKRLRVVKGLYGPYAENLTHVLREIEGHYITGYGDGGDEPYKQLELMPGAVTEAEKILQKHPNTHARFRRVADLVEGFESSFGLELLSTVHWVIARESPENLADVITRVHEWHERKKMFSARQIKLAANVLAEKGWIELARFVDTNVLL